MADLPKIPSETTLRLLVEAGRSLSSTLDAPTLYRNLMALVADVMPCDGYIVSSFDPQAMLISCDFCWTDDVELDVSSFPAIPLTESGGMQSEVIRTNESKIFREVGRKVREPEGEYYDVESTGAVRPVEEVEHVKTQTAVMVPMRIQDQVRGVVQVMCYQPDAYDESHIRLLEGLAFQLALAIQNARLYQQAQQEIAERRRAEEVANLAQEQFRKLLDAMPQIAWARAETGEIDYINRQLIEYTGASKAAEVTGEAGWIAIVHPDDLVNSRQSFINAVESRSVWEREVRLLRYDGQYRWHLSRMVPMLDGDGKIARWFGTSTDIHDVKEAEARMRNLNDELEERVADRTAALRAAIQELEGFTYSVSHDLRAPLRAISSTSSILLSDLGKTLDEDWRSMLVRQSLAANKMAKLIDELLNLSRISRSELNKEDIDLTQLAHSVIDELHGPYQDEAGSIAVDDGMTCRGDQTLMRLVMLNLIENAIKFSPNKTPIHVGKLDDGFFVRDGGIGFDPQFTEKIWKPFERLVSEREFPGTGIGLANVKRIVERHGGDVRVETAPAEGSTFFVSLGR